MAQIKLKAKLKAYSKSPFYGDYVRGVNVVDGVVQELEPNKIYGLKDGQWHELYLGDVESVNDRLIAIEETLPTVKEDCSKALLYVKNISVEQLIDENSIIFTDTLGIPHKIRLQVLADNESIRYNNFNQLELVNKMDNVTIKEDVTGQMVVDAIHYRQIIDGVELDCYVTGDMIASIISNSEQPSVMSLFRGDTTNRSHIMVQPATNDGVEGVITGVEWDKSGQVYDDAWENDNAYLKGNVDQEIQPTITINGLKERLLDLDATKVEMVDNMGNAFDVAYVLTVDNVSKAVNISSYPDVNTIVKRCENGSIKTNHPIEEDDCVSVGWLNIKLELLKNKLLLETSGVVNNKYYNSFINNVGDITEDSNYNNIINNL